MIYPYCFDLILNSLLILSDIIFNRHLPSLSAMLLVFFTVMELKKMIGVLHYHYYDAAMYLINKKVKHLDNSTKKYIALSAIIQTANKNLRNVDKAKKYLYDYLQEYLNRYEYKILGRILIENKIGYLKYVVTYLPKVICKIWGLYWFYGYSLKNIRIKLRYWNRYVLIKRSSLKIFIF